MRGRAIDVRVEETSTLRDRGMRAPQHTWLVRMKPWQIVPVFIAPVLAGDTLKGMTMNARVISDPIRNPVSGWWCEFMCFYVRVGDLEVHQALRDAIVAGTAVSGIDQAANVRYFHATATAPSWVYECLRVVTHHYFREEGEAWNDHLIDGYPAAGIVGKAWWDSLHAAAELPAEGTGDDWERAWNVYQGMRRAKLTTQTFEEYLAKSGVSTPPRLVENIQDFRKPELIRFVRDFTYPVPTVDPQTGLIASTVQWTMAERADKARFCAEPGWLFGVMCVRPKSYVRNHRTSVGDITLRHAHGWLPPEWETDPHANMLKVTTSDPSPLSGITATWWMDRRDLLLHGEQFLNIDLGSPPGSAGEWNLVALPNAAATNTEYPALADADALFTTAGREFVRVDGIVIPRIASRVSVDVSY